MKFLRKLLGKKSDPVEPTPVVTPPSLVMPDLLGAKDQAPQDDAKSSAKSAAEKCAKPSEDAKPAEPAAKADKPKAKSVAKGKAAAAAKAKAEPQATPAVEADKPTPASEDTDGKETVAILQGLAEKLKEPSAPGIWDMDEKSEAQPKAAAGPVRAPARSSRRNKTRLIGFDTSEGGIVDLFNEKGQEEAAEEQAAPPPTLTFPVGWALVIGGPGRGHAFPLTSGMSTIGRGADQVVRLDFGDTAISRQNHAAIVYDNAERSFLLGQGGKSNIVRLNGKPVISNETLKDGDEIKIGETVLRLKTLCGPDFDWTDTDDGEENEDVAIA